MALEKMTENVEIVQTLSTYPNQEDGLSAEELKAKFDAGAKAIKEYLNDKVVPAVQELERVVDPGMAYGLDPTLTISGRAADAGAVGTALAGKAPAGYGYDGKVSPSVYHVTNDADGSRFNARLDEIVATMSNRTVRQILFVDDPILGSSEYVGTLYRHNADHCVLTGWSYSGEIVRKYKSGGGWYPLEIENPPMLPGVEYRTTKRLNGKPVYAYMYNWGALPAAASTVKSVGIPNVDKLLPVIVASAPWSFPSAYSNIANSVLAYVLNASTIQIRITTATDESASTAFVVLEYTKTTG